MHATAGPAVAVDLLEDGTAPPAPPIPSSSKPNYPAIAPPRSVS
jgi:hypothetical protein